MPELPEVEVLRRSLAPRLTGRRIASVTVRQRALREAVPAARLARELPGRRVEGLRRRGKYLLVDLERDRTLVVHLGMSGRLTVASDSVPVEAHEHVSFALAEGGRLRYRDPRRFGLVLLLATARLECDRHFALLGLEPLGGELTGESLAAAARGRRGPVKAFLMDAGVVVGVGNIYACEALHSAGIHPARSVARLAAARWERLAVALRETLAGAIAQGGTTLNDFTDGEGNAGYFQASLAAYGREGEPCRRCGRPIRRIVQSGRGTFYCGGCQR